MKNKKVCLVNSRHMGDYASFSEPALFEAWSFDEWLNNYQKVYINICMAFKLKKNF